MKKLILTSFVLFAGMGILFASDCDSKDYANVKKSTPEIVLTSNNLQRIGNIVRYGKQLIPNNCYFCNFFH